MIEAAIAAVARYGAGSGAVRTISGTMSLHLALEERIAAFKNVEACVVFQSGFAANAGTVSAILGPDDHIVSDELNHASIIDGCRLSRAKIHVFPHKDVAAAEGILASLYGAGGKKLLISDGVFSMDGDIGPLPGLVAAAEKHGAIMMVDDAHASGVLGRNGRGTIDHFGLHGRVHVQVGTLSKAIGVLGGYVCGSRDLIEFLYHRARPFLFSTSHPPAVAAACLAAFDVLEREPERIDALWANARYFKQGLTVGGFRHRNQRDAHHAGDGRRSGVGAPVFARAICGRRAGDGHRFPHGSQGEGARTDNRGLHAQQGGPGPRAGGLREGREASGDSVGQGIAFRGRSCRTEARNIDRVEKPPRGCGNPGKSPAARPPALPISRAGGKTAGVTDFAGRRPIPTDRRQETIAYSIRNCTPRAAWLPVESLRINSAR